MNIVWDGDGVLIEKLSDDIFIIRGYEGEETFPHPYIWVYTVHVVNDCAKMKGFLSRDGFRIDRRKLRVTKRYLRQIGCTHSSYERIVNGRARDVIGRISPSGE